MFDHHDLRHRKIARQFSDNPFFGAPDPPAQNPPVPVTPPTTPVVPPVVPPVATPVPPVTTGPVVPSSPVVSSPVVSTPSSTSSSTTSTTTSSTTSTSTTQPPSSSTTPIAVATPPPVHSTTPGTNTVFSTVLAPPTRAVSSASASATSSAAPSSSTGTGTIVGIVGGGIAGVAFICIVIAFVLRRWRRHKDENSAFDPASFRRSAVLMDDPPTHDDTVSRGFNPRPPSMIERRRAAPTADYNQYPAQYQGPEYNQYAPEYPQYPAHADYQADPSYAQYVAPGFSPGQVVFNASPVGTPTSAHPFVPYAPYSPGSPHDMQQYPAPVLTRQPSAHALARQPSAHALARQPSAAHALARQPSAHALVRQPSAPLGFPPSPRTPGDYVDLDRSSVTPFQAAQYAEISRRLNSPAPVPAPAVPPKDTPAPAPAPSPFADPVVAPDPHAGTPTPDISVDAATDDASDLEPPAPAHARINSIPPSLPEITVHVRDSVSAYYDAGGSGHPRTPLSQFPSSPLPGPSPLGSAFPSGVSVPEGGVPVVGGEEGKGGEVRKEGESGKGKGKEERKRPDTMYSTIYNPEDAYGGI